MQAGVSLLVADVMPIYMIIPRYSHNYAQFYQLLDSTHRNTYAILREATSEIYGPGSIFIILIFQYLVIFIAFILLCIFIIYQKYYLIISIRSHSRK